MIKFVILLEIFSYGKISPIVPVQPKIIFFDEATSALDAASELAVKQALEALMENKTTLIIAHRLSTVVNADMIVVLDEGKIISQGTHTELLDSCEVYQELATIQLLD